MVADRGQSFSLEEMRVNMGPINTNKPIAELKGRWTWSFSNRYFNGQS
ncbi:hypothetical protein KHA80_08860 [Anaerobacillus sp. HL2]|nr:hypothetical protein KHA80_08860 [Anaerobacillus sp. HL2]